MNGYGRTTNLFLIIFMLLGHHAAAQRHYVYLQSEDRRPFNVRIGTEVHSSNATGYLIIPRLADSNYVFRVGYPQGEKPTAVFPVQMGHRDHGFQLVCSAQECLLLDLQDATRIKGVMEEVRREVSKQDPTPATADVFTNGLALAIGDPQLTRTELIKQEAKPVVAVSEPPAKNKPTNPPDDKSVAATQAPRKETTPKHREATTPTQERAVSVKEEAAVKRPAPEKVVPIVVEPVAVSKSATDVVKPQQTDAKKDSALVNASRSVDTLNVKKDVPVEVKVAEKPTVQAAPVVANDRPSLVSERRDATGCSYVFKAGPLAADTVDVWIAAVVEEKVAERVVVEQKIPEQKVVEQKAVTSESLTEKAKADIAADLASAPVGKKDSAVVPVVNVNDKVRTDCKARAVAKDVDALKKKLAGVRDEDEKVAAALAAVKVRCYDTEQVKALCGAFARNEGKYKLMDAAYPYVYDPSRYGELEGLLTDPYFVHRLKVLTGALNR